MEEAAKQWLLAKVEDGIIVSCYNISNSYDILSRRGYEYPFTNLDLNDQDLSIIFNSINKELSKIAMLLYNFPDLVDIDTLIPNYFSRKGYYSSWDTPNHISDFKRFIGEAKIILRDKKISNLV